MSIVSTHYHPNGSVTVKLSSGVVHTGSLAYVQKLLKTRYGIWI